MSQRGPLLRRMRSDFAQHDGRGNILAYDMVPLSAVTTTKFFVFLCVLCGYVLGPQLNAIAPEGQYHSDTLTATIVHGNAPQ